MPAFARCCLHILVLLPLIQATGHLAARRLLGAGVDFGVQTDWGRWEEGLALDPGSVRPWLFVAQQKRLSLGEMGIYDDHVAAAEEVDEDNFFGNFS